MKQKILLIAFYLFGFSGFCQESKINYASYVNQRLFDVGNNQNELKSLSEIQSSAKLDNAGSLNLLGLLYREGLGVEKNEDKAFEFILEAAKKELPAAEFNVGRLYMTGTGCDIDFDKAIYWLSLSADHGNERAPYALGYMYFKGFGVEQNYNKAIAWFQLSSWSMAKHYLGICYYFGFGVEKDEDKAIVYFSKSQTTNSNMFLKHIAENVKESVEADLEKEINEKETLTNTGIVKEAIDKTTEKLDPKESSVFKKEIKPKYLNGKWKGKVIELDYSKKKIVRVLPVSCEFLANENNITYKWNLDKKLTNGRAVFEDNAIYFDNLNMVFNMPYSENPNSNTLLWQLLSAQMEFKTINKKVYLTGNLQTFSKEWQESGPPMRIILRQTAGDEDFSEDEILELTNQDEHFITLYPNPFVDNVLIEYELNEATNVTVDVYDFSGNTAPISLSKSDVQNKGKYKYTLNGTKLKSGMYIVRVVVGNKMHSRILIKN